MKSIFRNPNYQILSINDKIEAKKYFLIGLTDASASQKQ